MSDKNTQNNEPRRNSRLGTWIAVAVIVATLCVAVMFYIGWFDNKTHVDTPAGDNVEESYKQGVSRPDSPGVNDWQNPDHNSVREVVVDHADTVR
ncbi:MAG: hypothetical protein ACI30N_02500 [Muribaculaceae bacterium]